MGSPPVEPAAARRPVRRGLIGSRLMRDEQSRPGRFDADGEIADGANPGGGAVSRKVNGADGTASKTTAPSPSSSQTSNPSLDNGETRRAAAARRHRPHDRQPPWCVTRLGHRLSTGAVRLVRRLLRSWLRLVRWRLIGAGGGKCLEPPGAELDALILSRRPALRSQGLTQGVVAVVEPFGTRSRSRPSSWPSSASQP